MEIKVLGRTLDVEFQWASQGFRMQAMEYTDGQWNIVPEFDGNLHLMQTHFEALCSLAFDLFDESSWGEEMAMQLGIPMQFYDEEDESE